jgi:hypothetical protein
VVNPVGIFVVMPFPDLVTLCYESPNSILETASWSDCMERLPPEHKVFIGGFLLREYQVRPCLCVFLAVEISPVEAFPSCVQYIGNI